jgi:hypothetical protein
MTVPAPTGARSLQVGVPRSAAALGLLALLLALSACGTFRRVCADGCNVRGSSPTGSVEEEIGASVPLLQSFELRFDEGDRPLARVAVGSLRGSGGATDSFYLELADGDGNDPMHGTARYFRWPERSRAILGLPEDGPYGVERFASRSGCTGSCDLTIPDFNSRDNVLVITGFRFRYASGENNLLSIGLLPVAGGGPGDAWTAVRATFQDDDGAEAFAIELSYLLFPRSWSNDGVDIAPDFRHTPYPAPSFEAPLNESWRGRIPLLGGFSLAFDGNDEHLLRLGVDATGERVVLTLRDNDAAESIRPEAIYWGFCPAPGGVNSSIVECP